MSVDLSPRAVRMSVGIVFHARGYNQIFGGGRITGKARWFEGVGMRPGVLHAWVASLTEVGAGTLLMLGALTPLACAGVIGTMVIAWIANHRENGFGWFDPPDRAGLLTAVIAGFGGAAALLAAFWRPER